MDSCCVPSRLRTSRPVGSFSTNRVNSSIRSSRSAVWTSNTYNKDIQRGYGISEDLLESFKRRRGALQTILESFKGFGGISRRSRRRHSGVFGGFRGSQVRYRRRGGVRGFSGASKDISEDVLGVSDTLQGCFWGLRRVSGVLQVVRGGFRLSEAFQDDS